MSKLYLFNYNNYYNRIFKRENSLADYGTPVYTLENTNFRYADGVDTDHIINYTGTDGDYVIITDSNDNILHRWFVVDDDTTRGGQRKLTLKRDLKVDYFDLYKSAPMIINKGWLSSTSPLLFNPEGGSYNQIKKEEILLNDASRIPWYVVYFAKNAASKSDVTFTLSNDYVLEDAVTSPINESIYQSRVINAYSNVRYIINAQDSRYISSDYDGHGTLKMGIASNGIYHNIYSRYALDNDYIWFQNEINQVELYLSNAFNGRFSNLRTLDTAHVNDETDANIAKIMAANGKYVKDSTNNIYKISVTKTTITEENYNLIAAVTDYEKGIIDNISQLDREYDWGDEAFGISYNLDTYVVSYTKETAGTLQWSIDFGSMTPSNDGTFNVITFPAETAYCSVPKSDGTSMGDYYMNDEVANKFIASLMHEYGSSIYDIQLLPYCPLLRAMDYYDTDYNAPYFLGHQYDPAMPISNKEVYAYAPSGVSSMTPCVFFYYIKDTTFTFDINQSISLDNYDSNNSINIKLNNECNLFRLVSPNYNGQFEFSVAKNGGVNYFNVDVTLRPYNPYIHVNPNFKNIYGADFNDSRGLICNGDFSIPMVRDAFVEYELNNKNYQQIFNRQIEHMDFTQHQERVQSAWSLGTGSLMGAAGGMLAGSKFGTTGMVAGAAIGGIASIAGGIADYSMMLDRQMEEKDFAIDNFNYQLGNIKAQPYGVTKVTPFTANNKKFPFVEKFTATDEEINILANKINYNSFTINNIGTIQEHMSVRPSGTKKFVQGTLIRIDGIDASAHEAMALSYELEKGVYI